MLYICRAKLRQVGTQCTTFSKHEKLCGDSYVTHDKKRTLFYILLQRRGARCGHARRAGRVCGGHVGARGRRDMCASVASLQLFLFITDSAQRARSWRLGAATPSPRSTDAVGGDGAAGLDAARGATNAAVGADGSELVDDATPTAAATTAERDKKVFFFFKKSENKKLFCPQIILACI